MKNFKQELVQKRTQKQTTKKRRISSSFPSEASALAKGLEILSNPLFLLHIYTNKQSLSSLIHVFFYTDYGKGGSASRY